MEGTSCLQIVQNVKIKLWECYRCILLQIYLVLLPFLFLSMYKVQFRAGDNISRLQHDIQTMAPEPHPVPSMWIDHDWFINGSSYVPSNLWREGAFETFILYFPWDQQLSLCFNSVPYNVLILIVLELHYTEYILNRNGKWGFVLFLAIVVIYSTVFVLALDGAWTAIQATISDKFLKWIESNIAEIFLDEDFKEETILHPFTLGLNAPFYLQNKVNYPGEDVVFLCEYHVSGDSDVEPHSITTWWRKNGLPVTVSDRLYVNISIESMGNQNGTAKDIVVYRIQSTLTIEVIQLSDYGSYTCDYINPMPQRIRVKPYIPENDTMKVRKPEPMTPHPKCSCQPTFNEEPAFTKPNYHSLVPHRVCFTEFALMRPIFATKTVKIKPGGILVSAASYRTVVSMSDIKVDVTFEGNTDRKGNSECCSMFVKLYWALFGHGGFVDLPISRIMGQHFKNSTSQLAIYKYLCICTNSFGTRKFLFFRYHFNSTIKNEEEIEIEHPVSLRIEPHGNGSIPLFDIFDFCSRSDQNFCWFIETLLENSVYIFYTYDVFFVLCIVVLLLSVTFIRKWSANFIAKPLRRLCFWQYSPYVGPFPAVEGPPLYLHCGQETSTSYQYDIYLSYNEKDKKVAKRVKKHLLREQMTVFDPVHDILPGRVEDHESVEAIQRSGRFVIIVSNTYTDDARKKIELVAIQDTIISQNTEPKNRMLIIQIDDCHIVGLHRVPCINVSLLENDSDDIFLQWMSITRSSIMDRCAKIKFILKLCRSEFSWKSIIFILTLVYLANRSSIFETQTQSPGETEIVRVE